jgi:tripartite ATP-independent transporter DctP family solute receptor
MAERVAEKSGGRLQMKVYSGGQLCSDRECLELLQLGSLDLAKVSTATMENFAPAFRVFGVPYLFGDEAHRFAVLDGPVGRELLLAGLDQRIRGLAYYDSGSRSFYTVERPAETPADLAGLKVRVMESPMSIERVRAFGGSATPISFGELYTALQQGVVDGAENNPPSFYLSRHYEVARHYVLDEHTAIPDMVVVGTPAWERLSPEEQRWVREAARESAEVERVLWREATDEALQAVREAGVTVLTPDKAPFEESVAPLLATLEDDPLLGPLIARIRETPSSPTAPPDSTSPVPSDS